MKRGKFEAQKPSRKPTAAQKHTGGASAPKQSGGGKKVGIILGCVILVAVLCVCAYGMILKGQDTIYPNVYVAGINVGGLKRDAAIHAVQEAVDQHTSADTLTVVLPDRSLSFTPEVSQVALNADEAVDQAMQYGRSGGPITALITYNRAKHNEYNVDLESSLNLDTEYIRSLIDQTARDVETDRIDPIVKVDEEAGTITVTAGSPAIHLDADALYDAVIQRFTTGNFSDLSFDYETTPCDPVDLQSYYDKYCTDTVDAYYDEEAKKLVPEEVGYGFDLAYYTQQIAMAKAGEVITIQMEDREPEVTLKTLEKEFFSDVLGQCDSPHTADANRTTNLELACKAINGTILNPGEEFSFNGVVGERTKEKGYKPAIVYASGGKSEESEGGGVCQVASTIYTACLLADMQITYREPHMYLVTYVEAGMDATVYWGNIDYKFKNNTEKPIRIDASVSGGYVHIKLLGTTPERDWDHIELSHKTINTKAYKTVIEEAGKTDDQKTEITIQKGAGVDANGNAIDIAVDAQGNKYVLGKRVNGAYTGYTVEAYRKYVKADGSVLKEEKLHTDVYKSRNISYEVTPYVEPEPEEPEDPENPDDTTDPTNPDSGNTGDTGNTGSSGDNQDPFGTWW